MPRGLAPLATNFVPMPPEPANLVDWQLRGETQSTLVRAQRSVLKTADAELSKSRLSARPILDVVGSIGA